MRATVASSGGHLRIHPETLPDAVPTEAALAVIENALAALSATTGWKVELVDPVGVIARPDMVWSAQVDPGVGNPPNYLVATATSGGKRPLAWSNVEPLAMSLVGLINELGANRRAVRRGEAELATSVPVVSRSDERIELAARLEGVLRAGAQSVNAQSAGLYLLDEATSELKLRAAWGLAPLRLADKARPLRGALADLEALLGHAVVLEDDMLHDHWKVPEPCGAAVCVPVATPSTLLGTLWVFSNEARSFDDRQTNQLEIIAGRLAADLEREALLAEAASSGKMRKQYNRAQRQWQDQLPSRMPNLPGWEACGWTREAQTPGGSIYDWWQSGDERVTLSLIDAQEEGPSAALFAAGVRSALRAHARHEQDMERFVTGANMTLYAASPGDQFASAALVELSRGSNEVRIVAAGQPRAILLGANCRPISLEAGLPLGLDGESNYKSIMAPMNVGETICLFSPAWFEAAEATGNILDERMLAAALRGFENQPISWTTSRLARLAEEHFAEGLPERLALLAFRRTK